MCAVGGNAVRDLKSVRIKLEHGDAAKNIPVGIEELVVINVRVLPEDPFAVGTKIGLSRLAFDFVAQRVLTFVGIGKIELIRHEKHAGDHHGGHEYGNDDAIEADAGGLDGCDFVGTLEQSKGDEHGEQHAERRGVVEEIGGDVEQVFADGEGRDLVSQDVTEQFEQSEHQQQDDERGDDHSEIERKTAQHIIVEDGREAKIEQAPPHGEFAGDAFAKGEARRLSVERFAV